jgi:ATP-dependent protease ClpP protease subunit
VVLYRNAFLGEEEVVKFLLTVLTALSMMLAIPAQAKSELPVLKLTKDNTAVLFGVIDSTSVSDVMQQIQKLDSSLKSGYPINLVMYTPGGYIQDGLELNEYLKSVNRPINTVTIFAASMGFQIVQNLKNRYILQNGVLMSHKAAGGFEGEFGDGNSQIDSRYGLWMARILEMDQQTVKRTKGKQTLKSYRAAYQNELWLTGNQAVAGGYADRVVAATCDKSLSGQRTQRLEFMGMGINVNYSECPLNTNPLSIEIEIPTNKGVMKHADFLAKGGVFIKDNKEVGGYGAPDLYCTDPSLTMELLKKSMSEVRKEVIARQRKIVKSY